MKKLFLLFALSITFCGLYAQTRITAYNAIEHIGKTVTIYGKVFDGKWAGPSATTTLYVDGYRPNEKLLVIIPLADRDNFSEHPESDYNGKTVVIRGTLRLRNHIPEIVVSDRRGLQVVTKGGITDVKQHVE